MKKVVSVMAVLLALQVGAVAASLAEDQGNEITELEDVVVTAPRMDKPLTVTTNPKAPRQPIPAHDGAEYLKSVPGFSIIRKGGTDGDPVFRGMSGSRLGIVLDGQEIYGGCSGRMDPPTAYVFPESYDRITVLKGPQNVSHGPGYSAGVALFERDIKRFTGPDYKINTSLTFGSFDRNDQMVDFRVGNQYLYVQGVGTRSDSNDYKDGDGRRVHSAYTRWSTSAAIGWTPNDDTLLELSGIKSDGEAAYADRSMDGAEFERENIALKFKKKRVSSLFENVEAQIYYNYVDHVMDNYSLRPQGATASAMNPDRKTTGWRVSATLGLSDQTKMLIGVDSRQDEHTSRNSNMGLTSGAAADASYRSKRRADDMSFDQIGAFGELSHFYTSGAKAVVGVRVDQHKAKDDRLCLGMMNNAGTGCMMGTPLNNTRGQDEEETLTSAFIRYEGVLSEKWTWFAGVGHSERFPDYWERNNRSEVSSTKSVFKEVDPEKLTQLDLGMNWKSGPWAAAVSGFYGKTDDYVLIHWSPSPTTTRNIDATTWGGEADLTYRISANLKVTGTIAYVRGENDTDDKALAQQPPLEGRLAVDYDNRTWSVGALWRLVDTQDRYDVGSGNIVNNGQDLGRTPGFGIFSVNAGWRPVKNALFTLGVDNLFDKTYAEHLSKTGASVTGYNVPTNERINEPGRNVWAKLTITF